jgi:hypothetical protein
LLDNNKGESMTSVTDQIHGKFKVFAGELQGNSIDRLAAEVESFVARERIAPKSIGVEFLESSRRVILTLGYRDDEPGYAVNLASAYLGKLEDLEPATLTRLEGKMAEAAADLTNVICHELLVTDEQDFVMVFLRKG